MGDAVKEEYDTCSTRTDPTDRSSEITAGVGDDAVVERSTGDDASLGVGDAVRFRSR